MPVVGEVQDVVHDIDAGCAQAEGDKGEDGLADERQFVEAVG